MAQYIDKDALVAKIERRIKTNKECMLGLRNLDYYQGKVDALNDTISSLDTLEVKEVGVWKTVDNINHPQADKNKIYCIFTKGRYILATVINHPKDEELLQWKCTDFPHHRYDMCEGDKYMQIV